MTDVFISYARADRKRVSLLAAALTQEGFAVWWDPQIRPGKRWNDVIRKALEGSAAVVTAWTPAAVKSKWVAAETTYASSKQKLTPVLLKPCAPPMPFNMIQSTDLSAWRGDGDDPAWLQLLQEVRRLVAARRGAIAVEPPGEAQAQAQALRGAAAVVGDALEGAYTPSRTRGRMGLRRGLAYTVFTGVVLSALFWGAWAAYDMVTTAQRNRAEDAQEVYAPPPEPEAPAAPAAEPEAPAAEEREPAPAPPAPPPPRVREEPGVAGGHAEAGRARLERRRAEQERRLQELQRLRERAPDPFYPGPRSEPQPDVLQRPPFTGPNGVVLPPRVPPRPPRDPQPQPQPAPPPTQAPSPPTQQQQAPH